MKTLQYLALSLPIPKASPDAILSSVLNSVYFISGIVAVVTIIVAGFMYTTSAGDAAKVTKAKNAILYSVIGLVFIALAFTITQFVIGKF